MRAALVLALLGALAGCGGATSSSGTTAATHDESASSTPAPTTAEVMALFERSCAGCHRHEGGDPSAVENGAYFDTEADIRRLMDSYGVGIAESGLVSLVAYIERDGELRIGTARVLMPPAGTSPPITREEARRILRWWQADGGP
jgi:mono/diheme cytochrome c family protein